MTEPDLLRPPGASAPLTLVGYFPKRRVPPPRWLAELGAREVGSVSECIAPGPDGWIHAWTHNAWGCFDSPALAWARVPEAARADYGLHAWVIRPSTFMDGVERPLENPAAANPVVALDASFRCLGYDVVSRSGGQTFECSPLTCNLLAREHSINRACLLDDLSEALELARSAQAFGCEPGPYLVVQVWRAARALPGS